MDTFLKSLGGAGLQEGRGVDCDITHGERKQVTLEAGNRISSFIQKHTLVSSQAVRDDTHHQPHPTEGDKGVLGGVLEARSG